MALRMDLSSLKDLAGVCKYRRSDAGVINNYNFLTFFCHVVRLSIFSHARLCLHMRPTYIYIIFFILCKSAFSNNLSETFLFVPLTNTALLRTFSTFGGSVCGPRRILTEAKKAFVFFICKSGRRCLH